MSESIPTYQLIRSKRKSLSLSISRNAELVVRAPLRMPQKEISEFIRAKQDWIEKKQLQAQTAAQKYRPLALKTGEHLPYLGRKLQIKRCEVTKIEIISDLILIPEDATKQQVVAWLRRTAKTYISTRAQHFAKSIGVSYSAIRISGAQTRWGSCSAKNSLSFTWRLIMCPTDVIDYVVVHELCHILHKNHSSNFWAQVEAVFPAYAKQRKWLKDNRGLMDLL